MDGSDLKKLWKNGTHTVGGWITLADVAAAGIMSNVGFDWIALDAEHIPFNPETLRNLILMLRNRSLLPIVRVRCVDEAIVKQALDWGAEGIIFPMIRTAQDAKRAVAACRYPPIGVRGFNPREATDFWKDVDGYIRTANDRIVIIIQIENVDALRNLSEILLIDGIDGLLIGPADLSFSLGLPLQQNHQEVQEAIESIILQARAAQVPVGMAWVDSAAGYISYLKRGLSWVMVGDEADFISMAATSLLRAIRELDDDAR